MQAHQQHEPQPSAACVPCNESAGPQKAADAGAAPVSLHLSAASQRAGVSQKKQHAARREQQQGQHGQQMSHHMTGLSQQEPASSQHAAGARHSGTEMSHARPVASQHGRVMSHQHMPGAQQSLASKDEEHSSDGAPETVPFVYGALARKALDGRQSLAPPKVHVPSSYQKLNVMMLGHSPLMSQQ